MEEKDLKKSPFFAQLLEKQIEQEEEAQVEGGRTIKYPSDLDETMKYPSDNDEVYSDI